MNDEIFGSVIHELWTTIGRRKAQAIAAQHTDEDPPSTSYTVELLTGSHDKLLKKVAEEAAEVVMAAKDSEAARTEGVVGTTEHGTAHDHLVYETCDLLYHILVLCARWDITPNDLAQELEKRFVKEKDHDTTVPF